MPYMVVWRESERGWGAKDYHAKMYDTYEKAKAAAAKTNAEDADPHGA